VVVTEDWIETEIDTEGLTTIETVLGVEEDEIVMETVTEVDGEIDGILVTAVELIELVTGVDGEIDGILVTAVELNELVTGVDGEIDGILVVTAVELTEIVTEGMLVSTDTEGTELEGEETMTSELGTEVEGAEVITIRDEEAIGTDGVDETVLEGAVLGTLGVLLGALGVLEGILIETEGGIDT